MSTNKPKEKTEFTSALDMEAFKDTKEASREEQEKHYMELGYLTRPVGESPIVDTSKQDILDRIDKLQRRIDFIFGDHVLINGRWVSASQGKAPCVQTTQTTFF